MYVYVYIYIHIYMNIICTYVLTVYSLHIPSHRIVQIHGLREMPIGRDVGLRFRACGSGFAVHCWGLCHFEALTP